MYKLAIFDFDGTLVDSSTGMVDVMRKVVQKYGMPLEVYEKWRHLIGIPLEVQLKILLPERNEEFWLEVANCYRAIYDAKALEICQLFPGLIQTLEHLKNSSVKMSIASSKRKHRVELVLAHHDLISYFDLILGAEDVSQHKPHPEAIYSTLKNLSIQSQDAIVVGDSTFDLEMASNAGVDAIGVTTGMHSPDLLMSARPKHIVNKLEDILPIVLNGRTNISG